MRYFVSCPALQRGTRYGRRPGGVTYLRRRGRELAELEVRDPCRAGRGTLGGFARILYD
jgi:hypothetical protein